MAEQVWRCLPGIDADEHRRTLDDAAQAEIKRREAAERDRDLQQAALVGGRQSSRSSPRRWRIRSRPAMIPMPSSKGAP